MNCTLYFLTKWLVFIFSRRPVPLEREVRIRDHRFADVEAREVVALEQLDLVALLGEQGGDGRAGRPAADHDDIGGGRHLDALACWDRGRLARVSNPGAIGWLVWLTCRLQECN